MGFVLLRTFDSPSTQFVNALNATADKPVRLSQSEAKHPQQKARALGPPETDGKLCMLLGWFLISFTGPAIAQTEFAHPAESAVFLTDTRKSDTSTSRTAGNFLVDTRGIEPERVIAESGLPLFTVDTRAGIASPYLITGTVRSRTGATIAGASILIKRYGQVFWEGASGPDGSFSPPALLAQNYTAVVTKVGYVTLAHSLGGSAGSGETLTLNLEPLRQAPLTQQTSQLATNAEKGTNTTTVILEADPEPQLMVFNGTNAFVNVTNLPLSKLNPAAMTIVLSHGWFSDTQSWALPLALLIKNHQTLAIPPNIVTWDWHNEADTLLPDATVALKQGKMLGAALRRKLGYEAYTQKLHFIGHSMGTLVNRYACDNAHQMGDGEGGDRHFDPALTKPHMTMLDEAEVSNILGSNVITAAQVKSYAVSIVGALAAAASADYRDWKSPIPATPTSWVDNYISMVGIQRPQTVNVFLTAPTIGFLNPIAAHAYAHQWYRDSVLTSVPPVGFLRSREAGGYFPPSGAGMAAGSLWYQDLSQNNPMMLVLDPNPTPLEANLSILGTYAIYTGATIGDTVTEAGVAIYQGANNTVHNVILDPYKTGLLYVGDKGGDLIIKTNNAYVHASEKIGEGIDAAKDKVSDIFDSLDPSWFVNKVSRSDFRIILGNSPPSNASLSRSISTVQTSSSNEPGAWVTVEVPKNAGLLQFDFMVTGEPSEDCIAAAVGGQNCFNLPAKFAPQGEVQSTDMMDISQYAGQTVELYFGLTGGTSTGCELAIDGIRFITIPQPTMVAETTATQVVLKWPAAAVGWQLESSEDLTSWTSVTVSEQTVVADGVITVSLPRVAEKCFYRLRRVD